MSDKHRKCKACGRRVAFPCPDHVRACERCGKAYESNVSTRRACSGACEHAMLERDDAEIFDVDALTADQFFTGLALVAGMTEPEDPHVRLHCRAQTLLMIHDRTLEEMWTELDRMLAGRERVEALSHDLRRMAAMGIELARAAES